MYENLLYNAEDGVCRITLNRPQVYNALNPGLIREITSAVQAAGADDSVRVVVITGTGDRAFCSGADLKEGFAGAQVAGAGSAGAGTPTGQMSLGESLRNGYHPMIRTIRNLPKPVVGRVNGVAAGAGCSLAIACDVVICTDEAYFSQIFVNIGLMPDAGSTFFLPRLVGPQRAFELSSTGRRVYGPEAVQIGLVSQSVPAAELDAAVDQVVRYYATAPTRAIGAMKLVLNQSLYSNLDHQLEQEAQNQDALGRSVDAAEGIGSFLMKRRANFSGR